MEKAMSELGKAYVQIIPSAKGIGGSIASALSPEASSAGTSSGQTLGNNLVSAVKKIIAAAGIGAAFKKALDAGGNLQQSYGGLETIYGKAADSAKKYAAEAAKAGISANNYAEQAVSFGASLKQAFSGDTTKAVKAANTAILDMADNAAKMGTPIESLQNAYQGFAKQNYTMLDNLKLGYGGTKSEMERLLADAEKLSGKKYDISNLGDVYEAIHVIQEELGLTGVAADEASTTLTGSMGAVKASFENVLANLSLGEDIRPSLETLMTSVSTFLTDNLFPMIKNIFQGLPTVLEGIGEFFIQAFSGIAQNADSFLQTGIEIATALINSIVTAIPNLAANFLEMVLAIGQAIINTDWTVIATNIIQNLVNSLTAAGNTLFGEGFNLIEIINNAVTVQLPQLLSKGTEIIQTIINGIVQNLPSLLSSGAQIISQIGTSIISARTQLFSSASDIISSILEGITAVLPSLLSAGVEILTSIANGIMENLPQIITAATEIVNSLITFILDNLPVIIQTGMDLLSNLCDGIIQNLPAIIEAATTAISTLLTTITEKLPEILEMGVTVLIELLNGIIKSLPDIVKTAAEVIAKLIFELTSHLPEILKMGMDLLGELIAGIIKQIPELIKAIPKVISGITDTFSKFDWQSVGSNLLEGIKNGIVNNVGKIVEAARNAAKAAFDAAKKFLGINSPSTEGTWLGEMYGLGVEKGIENKIIDIKKASLGIGQAAIDSVADMPKIAEEVKFGEGNQSQGKLYNITINVYASEGMSEEDLANEISYKLADQIERDEAVYA